MEYIFGTNDYTGDEILKTKGETHTDLFGFCQTVREYTDSTITDTFRVLNKYHSDEDAEGNCYDWYTIDRHNQMIDKTKQIKENLDVLMASMLEG